MKIIYRACLGVLVVVVIGLNLSKTGTAKTFSNARLVNLAALQSFAGDAGCEPTTQNDCSITVQGVTLKGKGQPYSNQ